MAGVGGVTRDVNEFGGAWCRFYRDITDPLLVEAFCLSRWSYLPMSKGATKSFVRWIVRSRSSRGSRGRGDTIVVL
jgi:hypothetical protein